ncbi:uncharacterized protein F4812DRAFT_421313 [Daldinia caldariorum]|uniref:uncharacterized protein n=1 Tax=Daldinia caldariorum TaxID=326644 RepID=UPI002008B8EC|nr:uncharacterized protein F4812DRAFT_421313 [Daldinia caldariorum]KAI1470052.1 hypothetical protein F4812DRAFT_421313 [Daldinia caldariorum]
MFFFLNILLNFTLSLNLNPIPYWHTIRELSNSNDFTMSSNNYSYRSSTISFSSSTTRNGETTASRYAQHTARDPSGMTTHIASQRNGEPPQHERRDYDASGRLISSSTQRMVSSPNQRIGGSGVDSDHHIQDVSDEQQRENDRLYEERIEDEYAKREGGA